MNIIDLCFHNDEPVDGYIEFRVGGVHPPNCRWVRISELRPDQVPQNVSNAYLGVTVRKELGVFGKDNFECSNVCWIDYDSLIQPEPILPPTMVVWSGHGWHFYWRLRKPTTSVDNLEKVNKALSESMGGDSCHNVDRIMRVPGTINAKDEDNPVRCKESDYQPSRVYTLKSLYASTRIDDKTRKRILTGDKRGFRSRSERDMSVIRSLTSAGLTDDDIFTIFRHHACGDKYRDPREDKPDQYLQHSIDNARKTEQGGGAKGGEITPEDDGYYLRTGRGRRRISTFTMDPTLLLEWDDATEDIIVCDVRAAGTEHVWQDIQFPVSSFNNGRTMSNALTKAAWVWLGRDVEVRLLRSHLVGKLQEIGVPRAIATSVVGRHVIDGQPFFVAHNTVLTPSHKFDGVPPIMYVDRGQESPRIILHGEDASIGFLEKLADVLPRLNEPGVIWPILGWFMASPFKTVLESETNQYRFPILNVFGTRGSGKTTILLRVFQPLMGYAEERSYDANTTRFVTLTLLGSSNTVPIAFSEFRVAGAENFTRYILLAYDTGRDPRGRADQTTTDYPLTAPFSIDGEDMVEDSAALERIIAVRMSPSIVAQGSDSWCAFAEDLQELGDLREFAGSYLRYSITHDIGPLIDEAEQSIWETYEQELPNRIRRNLTVAWFGVLAFNDFLSQYGIECMPDDGAAALGSCLSNVYSVKMGRAATEADSFVELIINAAARKSRSFPWNIDSGVLWFQLMPAFEYYMSQRTHTRRTTLTRRAIKTQLLELVGEFMVEPEVRVLRGGKVIAYGVNLVRAHDAGLDVPHSIKGGQYIIDTGGS